MDFQMALKQEYTQALAAEFYVLSKCFVPADNAAKCRKLNLHERITVRGILAERPWIMRGGQQYIRQYIPGFICYVNFR